MNVHYAKFQKSLIVEQFQGNYLNYILTVFKNFREEIEAAKTLLFGLSAGAGVSALSGSSFQSIPSASLKMTNAQSSQPPVIPNTSRLNSKRAGSESDSDSEDDDLGFGESDYFHDNKYGKKLSSSSSFILFF